MRCHDFQSDNQLVQRDFYEFHLTYLNMELIPERYLEQTYPGDFVVDAPELFAGSRPMDLASPDEAYRQQSIKDTQRFIQITRDQQPFFPNAKKPLIVANFGGFTIDEPPPLSDKRSYYERFSKRLTEPDMAGVQFGGEIQGAFPQAFWWAARLDSICGNRRNAQVIKIANAENVF